MTATATATAPPPGPSDTTSGELSSRQIVTILVGLMLGMFLAALDQTVVSTAIRTIADDLGGLSQQAWATTAFLITSTIATPLYGKLSDIYGRKPFFLLAISIFVIGSVTCTFAGSMYQLAAFRGLQGIGAGGLFSLALTILGDIVPPRERARYQGMFLAVFATSSVLGPVIGGLLSGANDILGIAGWRWIFLVNVPIGLVALVVVAKVLNLPHTARRHPRIDWPGALTLAIGLVPLLIVAEQGRSWGWGSGSSWICYVIGAVGLVLFALIERWYGDDALLPLRLFRNSVFSLVTVIGVIVGIGMFGGIAVLPQFLQIVGGATPIQSGFLMLPLVAGIMVASLTSGQVTSRTGHYKVFPIVGTFLMTAAMAIMHFRVNVDIPFWELDIYMAMFGLGLGCCMQTLVLAAQNASPARDMGVVTASSTFFRQLGGTVGTAVFFSILFSTVPDKIRDALTSAQQGDTAFQAAVTDSAVRSNPANQPFFALAQQGSSASSNVLSDSAFLQTIDARLARPLLEGFSNSITLVFLVAACVMAVAFVLVLFVKELPLRTMSGARAAAMEAEESGRAAGTESAVASGPSTTAAIAGVPTTVAEECVDCDDPAHDHSTSSVATASSSNGPGASNGQAASGGQVWTGHTDGSAGRHALASDADGHPNAERRSNGWVPGVPTDARPLSGPGLLGTVHRADGVGLPNVVVTVADPTGRQEARTTTDDDGEYALALRTSGSFLIVAAAGAYQPHAALIAVGDDAPTRHDVTLSGTSGVRGTVRDARGEMAGAAVTLIDAHGDVAAAGFTDGDGHYRLAGVPDGAYTLTATAAGAEPVAASLWLDVGTTAERDLQLPQRARVTGTVVAAGSGHGVEEATASLVDAQGTVLGSMVTGADGTFAFDDVPAGTYTLTARGYAPVAQTVHVEAGQEVTADVTLGAATRQVPTGS